MVFINAPTGHKILAQGKRASASVTLDSENNINPGPTTIYFHRENAAWTGGYNASMRKTITLSQSDSDVFLVGARTEVVPRLDDRFMDNIIQTFK